MLQDSLPYSGMKQTFWTKGIFTGKLSIYETWNSFEVLGFVLFWGLFFVGSEMKNPLHSSVPSISAFSVYNGTDTFNYGGTLLIWFSHCCHYICHLFSRFFG